jgi:multidrug efflux pump subunit AcrB
MWLIRIALRRPITVLVMMLALALGAWLAAGRMRVDILPKLGSPTIYLAQPYGGLDPSQMEGFVTYYYEYHLLYVTGIQHVESRSIQGAALIKLTFYPGTNMDQALPEVIGYANRSRAFMPPGAVPPFIARFDAGSVPVGQLVFSSPTRSPGEMQNIALNQVRPIFATLPGVSAPPPFGGNQRTMVVRVDPDKLRHYHASPEEVIAAVQRANTVMPSGNVRTGDLNRFATTNANVGGDTQLLLDAPLRVGPGPMVYLRDVASVDIGTDVVTGYAHVNGRRTVYMNVTKRSDASTLDVIRSVRENLGRMRAACPEDVTVDLVFDQSVYVVAALRSLISEGLLGALLTGLMVLVFLRDWRGAMIVMLTIPFSLLGAVICLWITGQTINLMTLAGLALAVGVLVDEATVEIENVHATMTPGVSAARAVKNAASRTALARLLSMLCLFAVFAPALFMAGVAQQLFVPLSLAVAFALANSYVLSSTAVPVLASWWMRPHASREFGGKGWYERGLTPLLRARWVVVPIYLVATFVALWWLTPRLGTELFPSGPGKQITVRLKAAAGTRIERTELVCLQALSLIKQEAGDSAVEISTAFIGVQPPSYPINTIHLWTGGPHEAVLTVALKQGRDVGLWQERLRDRFAREMPGVQISFEPADLIGKVFAFGSPTPVEVAVQSASMAANRTHAAKVLAELRKIPELRDLQYKQALDYPTLEVKIDRDRAGQFGLSAAGVAKSLVAATSSSRFIEPMYWRDPGNGNGFQIQVEIPQHRMQSLESVADLPVMADRAPRPLLGDVAELKTGTAFGEVERYDMQRVVSVTANLYGRPLGSLVPVLEAAIARAGTPPRGTTVALRGQVPAWRETLGGLRTGLWLALGTIFLLLVANFQSWRLAAAVLSTAPAALLGVVVMLTLTRDTLNVQSYLGAIMAVGIAVANAILLVTFAVRTGGDAIAAAREGASGRLRAILMTACAMIAGMVPLALALGEGSEQSAPLGRAVIGGLAFATVATLTVLPCFYAVMAGRPRPSLDPDDPESRYFEHAS